jgi:hypothetical protein
MNSPWSQQWRFAVTLLVLLGLSLALAVFDPSCHRPPNDPIRTLIEHR